MKKFIYYLLNIFAHNMETEIVNILKTKKKLVIFDVGCFKGVFSRKILNLIKQKKSIFYLFDINKNSKNYISDLISMKNVKFNEIALSNKNGKATYNFNRFFESSGSSLSKLFRNDSKWVFSRKILLKMLLQKTESYTQFKVKTTTLDNFVKKNKIKGIDILKVDIDGSELEFLKGAKNTLKKNKVRLILIEINDKKSTFKKKEKNIINMFNINSYSLIKKHINHSVSIFSNAKSGDYLFLRRINIS
tara:strand:- start:54 stop:794 length:741 start_codon:yes stop_codon:yes gene_type:complete